MSAAMRQPVSDTQRLDLDRARLVVLTSAAVAALGVVLCLIAMVADRHRFAFSYLTGFMFVMTLGLGGMFFVLVQHLTRAGWSVAARRPMEWLAAFLPVGALLFIPVLINSHDLFHHWMGSQAAADPILKKKLAYLNPTFFYIRAGIYFVCWSIIGLYFWRTSRRQDETGDRTCTTRMQMWSAPAMVVFALTLTFAAFDWLMSLDPHWYSTIFGVYVFAGSAVGGLALLALITIALQRYGLLRHVSTVEHRHDIGKLLFAFTVFWAYIAYSQYMLIWYANIPEETIFYRHRWVGGWKYVSLLLVLGHFLLPFLVLLSRTTKRSMVVLGVMAAWLLALHYVDLYWLVMPTLDTEGARFTWIDAAGLLGPLGVLLLWLALRAALEPLYPLRDPRLAEAVGAENP